MELFVGESGGLIGIKLLVLASLEVSSSTSFDCFSTTDDVDGPIRGCWALTSATWFDSSSLEMVELHSEATVRLDSGRPMSKREITRINFRT